MAVQIVCPLCEKIVANNLKDIDPDAYKYYRENGIAALCLNYESEDEEVKIPQIVFEEAEKYAEHIRDFHKSDIRYLWAKNFLDNLETEKLKSEQPEKEKLNPQIIPVTQSEIPQKVKQSIFTRIKKSRQEKGYIIMGIIIIVCIIAVILVRK